LKNYQQAFFIREWSNSNKTTGTPNSSNTGEMILAYLVLATVLGFMIYLWCVVRSHFLALGNDNQITKENYSSGSQDDSEQPGFLPLEATTNKATSPGVNFTNILRSAFTLVDPKSIKRY
jgi:hypothetical protein